MLFRSIHNVADVRAPKTIVRANPTPKIAPQPQIEAKALEDVTSEIDDDHDPDNAWLKPIVQVAQREVLKSLAKNSLAKDLVRKQIAEGMREAEKALKEADKSIKEAEAKGHVTAEQKRAIQAGQDALRRVKESLTGLDQN